MAHRVQLVNYASKIVYDTSHAEDVVQEAWTRLSRASENQLINEPVRYLYRIVRNLSIDFLRRSAREGLHVGLDMEIASRVISDDAPCAEATLIAREEMRIVLEAIAELPERERIAIEMYRFGNFKLREIAEHLGVSVGLVHSLIADGLAHCDRRRNARI
ncbi:MAG: sigma-70 family RNA polymerase sigma factor [Emcibacter sp.]|nr:sigma-70 family RNA polymerase sigma factor [Emcibacter sp.]